MMDAFWIIVRKVLPFGCGATDGRFDLGDACPTCGTGARRVDPILLPVTRLSQRIEATIKGEIVIPPRSVEDIRKIAPQCLRGILDSETGEPASHFEFVPERVLPPWAPSTSGWTTSQMDPPCPVCRRDGHYNIPHVPLQLIYVGDMPAFQFGVTYECFGRSVLRAEFSKSQFARPQTVVSGAIKSLLAAEKNVDFVPVTHVLRLQQKQHINTSKPAHPSNRF